MGSWRRMGAFLGLVPGDERDEGDYDDAYGPGPYSTPDRQVQDSDRSRFDRSSVDEARGPVGMAGAAASYPRSDRSIGGGGSSRRPARDDYRGNDYGDLHTQGALAMQPRPQSMPEPVASTAGSRPMTVKLTGFGEARSVGEKYRGGSSVILDMTDLSDSDARRVVDFAAGLAFAMRGSIDKVTTRVFMLLPPDMDLSAEDRRAYVGSYSTR